eukprot:2251647-Rhodomonas_salina.1
MESDKKQVKTATSEESTNALSSPGKSKNRRRPPKKKGGAKGGEKEENISATGGALQGSEVSPVGGLLRKDARMEGEKVANAAAVATAEPTDKVIKELQKELSELTMKHDAVLEQLKVAEAAHQGLEKVLEARTLDLHSSKQTI